MTDARTHSNSDRTSVALPAGVRAATTVSPSAVAAPIPNPAFNPPASALAGLASAGSALSFDAEVAALERAGWSLPKLLAERQGEKASAEEEYSCCCDGKVSLWNDVSISTHDTPVGSAPSDDADELIKDFGIVDPLWVIPFGTDAAASRFQPSELPAMRNSAIASRTLAAKASVSNSTSLVKA